MVNGWRHDTTEILLKLMLNTIQSINGKRLYVHPPGVIILFLDQFSSKFTRFLGMRILSQSHSLLITAFVTRVTQRMPPEEQELLTLPEHLSSPPIFCRVCVAQSFFFLSVKCFEYINVCPFVFFWPLYYLSFFLRLLNIFK